MSRVWVRSLSIVGVLAWSASALAYVPPSEFQLKTLAKKHVGYKVIRMKSLLQRGAPAQGVAAPVEIVTAVDLRNQHLKAWAFDVGTHQELYSVTRKLAQSQDHSALFNLLLWGDSSAMSLRQMKLAGILPETGEGKQQLKRFGGKVSWVVGEPVAQLWMEKDLFLPTKLILGEDEVRISGFRTSKEFPYPAGIDLVRKDAVVLHEEIVEFTHETDGATMKQPAGATDPNIFAALNPDIRDLIQTYFENLR